MQHEPKLMTLDTAAQRYAVSRKTVERWCRQGLVRLIKIGGASRLNIEEADAALGVARQ